MKKNFQTREQINLREQIEITEKIIQDKIADDPSILGLGDLILKDKKKELQPRGWTAWTPAPLQDPESFWKDMA